MDVLESIRKRLPDLANMGIRVSKMCHQAVIILEFDDDIIATWRLDDTLISGTITSPVVFTKDGYFWKNTSDYYVWNANNKEPKHTIVFSLQIPQEVIIK